MEKTDDHNKKISMTIKILFDKKRPEIIGAFNLILFALIFHFLQD